MWRLQNVDGRMLSSLLIATPSDASSRSWAHRLCSASACLACHLPDFAEHYFHTGQQPHPMPSITAHLAKHAPCLLLAGSDESCAVTAPSFACVVVVGREELWCLPPQVSRCTEVHYMSLQIYSSLTNINVHIDAGTAWRPPQPKLRFTSLLRRPGDSELGIVKGLECLAHLWLSGALCCQSDMDCVSVSILHLFVAQTGLHRVMYRR
jgi:hypothetical protein